METYKQYEIYINTYFNIWCNLVYYGLFTPQYAEVGQQWTIIGGGFLFGGLFLYVYIGKKKEQNQKTTQLTQVRTDLFLNKKCV